MQFGWLLFAAFSILLDCIVVYYAVKGPWKRIPLVLVFCAVQILVGLANALFTAFVGPKTRVYFEVYWTGDVLAHLAIISLMIFLIHQGLNAKEAHGTTKLLIAGVVCFAIFSVYTFRDPHLNRWMIPISRNLSFCEEILNLILWTILLQRRASDYLLLMVSAGIGVQVTGEVIGHTLRLYSHSPSTVWVPNLLVYVCEIVCLVIWIWAFRSARGGQSTGTGTPAIQRLTSTP